MLINFNRLTRISEIYKHFGVAPDEYSQFFFWLELVPKCTRDWVWFGLN